MSNSGFISTYKELKDCQKSGIRDGLRSIALTALSLKNRVEGIDRYLFKPRIQFLYLHHVFKDEEKKFDDLLKTLSKHHEFISYSDAVDRVLKGNIDRPYVCFSSDDGFKNNIKAAEILNSYNAKACFFVNPLLIGEKRFDRLNVYCRDVLRFPVVDFLDWNDIESLQLAGHEIGGHTMAHMNIAEASEGQINDDLGQTFNILNERCGSAKHFAFPYGRFYHFSNVGRKAVFNSGFTSCASAERGCHINHPTVLSASDLCIRRDQVILAWRKEHIMYFLVNSSKKANFNNNLFPPLL